MRSIESVQVGISKKISLSNESTFKDNNSKVRTNKFDSSRKTRVRLGGISKQRRRNEPIGSIGDLRLYVLEDSKTKEIVWLKLREPSKEAKQKINSKGYRILATYHADEKGEIRLPKGIIERKIILEMD